MTRRIVRLLAVALLGTACSDALEQTSSAGQYVGFITQDNFLLLLSATDLTQRLVQLESGTGTGQRLTARGSVFLASISGSARVDVVDVAGNPDSVRRIPLGFDAIDAAMADDSIAWVATSNGFVQRVNYRAGVLENGVFLGPIPAAVAFTAGRVFAVVNVGSANPSFVIVVDPIHMAVIDTVRLTPAQARLAVVGGDSLLYIVSSRAGPDSGKVSVVDPVGLQELVVINGLGTGPAQALFHPAGSRLLVASGFSGIQEVNTLTRTLTRPPSGAVQPNGNTVLGMAIDQVERIYAADSSCAVEVLRPPPDYSVRNVVAAQGLHCPTYAAVATKP